MSSIFDIASQFSKAVQSEAKLMRQINTISAPIFPKSNFTEQIKPIAQRLMSLTDALSSDISRSFFDAVRKVTNVTLHAKLLDKAGWLPHHSTPFSFLENCEDAAELHTFLSKYYRDNWPKVSQSIQSSLEKYDIDDEAKLTFCEALQAHEMGFYRCVCRVLLPEAERVSRKELHHDVIRKRVASQSQLRKLASEISPSSIRPGGFYALNLYQHLANTAYKCISTETERQQFAVDPVPNRHAVVHGYVTYSTMQNSLNTIFLVEFIFQVISILKSPPS